MAQCQQIKEGGGRCGQAVPEGATLCLWHDPDRVDEAAEARTRGGQNGKRPREGVVTIEPHEAPGAPPETIEDALRWASWAVWAVSVGKLDGRTAHEVAYILRTFLAGKRHLDKVDARVKELSEKMKALRSAS